MRSAASNARSSTFTGLLCNNARMQSTPRDLIGTSEAARILERHPATITRMVQDETLIPAGRLGSAGAFVFDRKHVEDVAQKLKDAKAKASA